MKRLKAWFHRTVVEAVERAWADLHEGYKRLIEDHIVAIFDRERERFWSDLEVAKLDLKKEAGEIHQHCLIQLAEKSVEHLEGELKAFESKVQHTLTACIKDEPAHWRAEPAVIEHEITLRTPKR